MRRRQKYAQAGATRPVATPKPATVPKPDPREEYARRFGKPPHPRMKIETIKARLTHDHAG